MLQPSTKHKPLWDFIKQPHPSIKGLFWLAVAVIIVGSLTPAPDIPSVNMSDKIQHCVGYAVLGILGFSAYHYHHWKKVWVGLILLGGALEIAQGVGTATRTADWLDFLANSLGVLISVLIFYGARFFISTHLRIGKP